MTESVRLGNRTYRAWVDGVELMQYKFLEMVLVELHFTEFLV